MAPSNLKWAGGAKNLRLSVLSRKAVAKSDCKEVLEEIRRRGLMNYSEKAVMETRNPDTTVRNSTKTLN